VEKPIVFSVDIKEDKMGLENEKFFWYFKTRKLKQKSIADDKLAHIIISSTQEETEAGTEGEIYTAYCGEQMTSWWYPQYGIDHKSGSLEQSKKDGMTVCLECKEIHTQNR